MGVMVCLGYRVLEGRDRERGRKIVVDDMKGNYQVDGVECLGLHEILEARGKKHLVYFRWWWSGRIMY